MVKLILIGGTYGSGKSTTAERLHESSVSEGYNAAIVDYDSLIGNGHEITDRSETERLRRQAWNHGLRDAIETRIVEGHDVIIVPATFSTRERRESFIAQFADREDVELNCLFIMQPMRETISRIQRGRRDNTHLVNFERWRQHYRAYNVTFRDGDHTDLLLPTERGHLAPEHRALLTHTPANHEAFHNSGLDQDGKKRWVVLTQPLDIPVFMGILRQGHHEPVLVRDILEGRHTPQDVGHEAMLPRPIAERR